MPTIRAGSASGSALLSAPSLPITISWRLLSERGAQIVGRLSHEPFFRISAADDTTAGQGGGPRRKQSGAIMQKRRPVGPPFSKAVISPSGQFAALLAGLSIAALSRVAASGAAALPLMPWSRSSASFNALSSLASGGT